MATKTVDVTLASIKNESPDGRRVSPVGDIWVSVVRVVNDEEQYQAGHLYGRSDYSEPLVPGGGTFIEPEHSITINSTKRLNVSTFAPEDALDQMLCITYKLNDATRVGISIRKVKYSSNNRHKIRFEELNGLQAFTTTYAALYNGEYVLKLGVSYTTNVVSFTP